MKLKKQFENYLDLYKEGFLFNPDQEIIFITNEERPIPETYSHWKTEKIKPESYLIERLKALGVKKNENQIELIGGVNLGENERVLQPIFTSNKFGDIEISQFGLDRRPHTFFVKDPNSSTATNREEYHVQKRLSPWHEYIMEGKYDFSKAKNTPFWSPMLVDAYENETILETLIITEGQIKAFKACKEGLPVVGLTSITHYRSGNAIKSLHREIVDFINRCQVKKVVILWDGDCLDISLNALENGEDITRRPGLFKSAALNIKDEVEKYCKKVDCFFAMINSEDTGAKGIDDLLIDKPKERKEIREDFENIGNVPGKYIAWENINKAQGEKRLNSFFNMVSERRFYEYHQEKIRDKDFVYFGSTYKIENGEPVIKVSKDLKRYKLIGTNFFRILNKAIVDTRGEKIGQHEELVPWKPEIIKLKHGKDSLQHIETYLGFCNIASHLNYKQVIDNRWNLYSDVKHQVEKGDFPYIKALLEHLFEEHFENEMIYDYFSILYTLPYHKLPILCLVSEEEGTGKSTFLILLKMIFKQNMALITSEDFMGQWTSHWIDKLIVASEETFFEKAAALDKLKHYSTAETVMRSERFVNNSEIECIMKFVFCSNYEDNFIKLTKNSSRFWVRKVKSIKGEKDPDYVSKMREEIPAFIEFISQRDIVHPRIDRLWFSPDQFKTDALEKVIQSSEPTIVKDLRQKIKELFYYNGHSEIVMDLNDLRDTFRISERFGDNYLRKEVIKGYIGAQLKAEYPISYSYVIPNPSDKTKPLEVKSKGRPFVFYRSNFINDQEDQKQVNTNPNQLEIPID